MTEKQHPAPKWIKRWDVWISARPVAPGVWKRREGGHLIRARAVDPRTKQMREVRMVLERADLAMAVQRLQQEVAAVKGSVDRPQRMLFSEYAASLLTRKKASREILSAKTLEEKKWMLEHRLLPVFGHRYVDEIHKLEIERWKTEALAPMLEDGYSPNTLNTWMRELRTVLRAAVADFELPRDPMAAVKPFDTSTQRTYTRQQPNSLTMEELVRFLNAMETKFPQFYAMTYLGFTTGWRPSTMRPLTWRGPDPDVLWDEGIILLRKSQTRGKHVMETTKTKRDQAVALPPVYFAILRRHLESLKGARAEAKSDLLFPSRSTVGGFCSPSCLDKPFAEICKALKLTKRVTPRGMRRTFQDMARGSGLHDYIARSVSGHRTAAMQEHYSTA